MKKLFAALLAIFVTAALAGCVKSNDEQVIDDITEDTSLVTETSKTVSETETTSESVSDTTTTASAETSAEVVSETKAEAVTEKQPIPKNAEKPFRQTQNHLLVNGMP